METTVSTETVLRLLQAPMNVDTAGVPMLALPSHFKLESLEAYLQKPRFTKRKVVAHDVRGFIDYVNRYKIENTTQIFCTSLQEPSLLARIDDHAPSDPSHVHHTGEYKCPVTHEWKQWRDHDGTKMDQVTFGEFVEDNIKDVVEPSGAELLKLVLDFRDTGSVEFSSAVRLANGKVQFKYAEKNDAGELQFPEKISIAIPVFEGDPGRYPMDVKLRYRVTRESGLELWFQLERPDLVLKQAYDDLIAKVVAETQLPLYRAI